MSNDQISPTVLVVDDEESIRFTLGRYLKSDGYAVLEAASTEEAHMLMEENLIHVAVIDRMLSNGEDGIGLMGALRKRQPLCQTLIISAYPSFESAAEAMAHGPYAYLSKPVRRDQILNKVNGAFLRYRKISEERCAKLGTMGIMVSGMVHDFNNLLTGIMGHCSLADLELDDSHSKARHHLKSIEEAGGRVRDMFQQVSSIGRRSHQSDQRFSLEPMVNGILSLLAPTIPENVTVRFHATPPLPKIAVTAVQMYQMMLNLIGNAVHAMRRNGGILSITLSSIDPNECGDAEPDSGIRVTVEDTGEGMSPDVLSRIFDPLFTTKPAGEGTGIGLALVRQIVAEHDGTITAQSEPGKGTRFIVRLPASGTDIIANTEQGENHALSHSIQ